MKTASIYDMTAAKRKVKTEQKAWKYLRDICGQNGSDLNRLAIIDGDIEIRFTKYKNLNKKEII